MSQVTKIELPIQGNETAAINALIQAVRHLATFCARRPEWTDERDRLLESVQSSVDAGQTDQNTLAFLSVLIGGGK